MFKFLYNSKIRNMVSVLTIILGIIILIQGAIGVYFTYRTKNSSQKMYELTVEKNAHNVLSLLERVDYFVKMLETNNIIWEGSTEHATYNLIADSDTFNSIKKEYESLVESNFMDIAFNNSFFFLSDSLPLTYVAPDYNTTFDVTLRSKSTGIYAANSIEKTHWFQFVKNSSNAHIWVENVYGRNLLCFSQNVYKISIPNHDLSSEYLGVFFISFDLDTLLNQLNIIDIYPQTSVALSYNDNIIFSINNNNKESLSKSGTHIFSLYPGLKLHFYTPKKNINIAFYIQIFTTIIMSLLVLILGGFLILYTLFYIIVPIENMNNYLLKRNKIPPSLKKLPSEIITLYKSHNIMIDNINQSIIEKQRSYYKMLQAQINPHFLYNTLNTISSLSLLNGELKISRAINNLVSMLRYSINEPDRLTKLSEELDIVKNFVEIQNFRHKKKISIEYDIPENLLNIELPKLTIQPLIENSIFHSDFDLNEFDMQIQLYAYTSEDYIYIVIQDNNHTDIDILNQYLQDKSKRKKSGHQGLGIFNINKRLSLLFGPSFGLRYNSNEKGLQTIILLPADLQMLLSQNETDYEI